MDFNFPFPTLKQLSIIRIGEHMVNEKIGIFQALFDWLVNDKLEKSVISSIFSVVEKFPIPPALMPEMTDILTGVYRNAWHFLKEFTHHSKFPDYCVLELIFDVHGRLNQRKIWELYFERMSGDCVKTEDLYVLLYLAAENKLLPQMDYILHRLLDLSPEAEASKRLQGPNYKIICEKFVVYYTYKDNFDTEIYSKAFCCLTNIFKSSVYVEVGKENLAFIFNMHLLYPGLCLEFFSLLDPSKKRGFATRAVHLFVSYCRTGFIVDILKLLDHETLVYCLSNSDINLVLLCLLEWPLTAFFIPMLEFLLLNFPTLDYQRLFYDVVKEIPSTLQHGFLYTHLLIDFLSVLPHDMKPVFRASLQNNRNFFFSAMRILQNKNADVHSEVLKAILS